MFGMPFIAEFSLHVSKIFYSSPLPLLYVLLCHAYLLSSLTCSDGVVGLELVGDDMLKLGNNGAGIGRECSEV